jgi:hypothetical protein
MLSTKIIIDADSPDYGKFLKQFRRAYELMHGDYLLDPNSITVCKTKHGYHVYLKSLVKLRPYEIIFLQAVFGSDFKREILNWHRCVRLKLSTDMWNVLFTQKAIVTGGGKARIISRESFEARKTERLKEIIAQINNR